MSKVILAAGLFGCSTYTFFLIGSIRNHVKRFEQQRLTNNDTSLDTTRNSYPVKNPEEYDQTVNFDELLMGIWYLRYKLMRQAKSPICESAIGTGRNYSFFHQKDLQNFVGYDVNDQMLAQASDKWTKLYKSVTNLSPAKFTSDKNDLKPKAFSSVVQTFGLCSSENPVEMLNDLGKLVKPDTGRILLLEHGKSHYNWLNRVLDAYADGHNKNFGCLWNRDILKIVEQSNLEIITLKRYHFGTTYYIIAKPK